MYTLIRQAASLLRMMELYEERVTVIKEILGVDVKGLRELSDGKLRELIKHLRILYYKGVDDAQGRKEKKTAVKIDSADKMRKTIISNAYQMQWADAGDWRTAIEHIDNFCLSPKGIYKKRLNEHNQEELNKVVTQFKCMTVSFLKQVAMK